MNNERIFKLIALGLFISIFSLLVYSIVYSGTTFLIETKHIGAVFIGDTTDNSWNEQNYNGLSAACESADATLHTVENVSANDKALSNAVHELLLKDCSIIFLTSESYVGVAEDIIREYDDTIFFCYGAQDDLYGNLKSYSQRTYQPSYLAGIIAGMTTKSDLIGYIGASESPECILAINAFTLGARSVNEDAYVCVRFTESWSRRC